MVPCFLFVCPSHRERRKSQFVSPACRMCLSIGKDSLEKGRGTNKQVPKEFETKREMETNDEGFKLTTILRIE